MKRIFRPILLLRRRGVGFLFDFFYGHLFPRWTLALLSRFPPHRLKMAAVFLAGLGGVLLFVLLGWWRGWGTAGLAVLSLIALSILTWWAARQLSISLLIKRARAMQASTQPDAFTRWDTLSVEAQVRSDVREALESESTNGIVLGEIDADGRLLSDFGALPGWQPVARDAFAGRHRFPLALVLLDGLVLVRKSFGRDRLRFAREWHNLALLAYHANVPAVYRADEKNRMLYKNMVVGRTIRDVLVESGAKILNKQTDKDPALAHLRGEQRLHAILARGRQHLQRIFQESFFQKLERQIDTAHRHGIVNLSLTFGNVMVDSQGEPWLIDMEGARSLSNVQSPWFLWQRDQDRRKYARIYGREVMTEALAREKLDCHKEKLGGWYAPVDFGGGLAAGGFWSIESGTGRWAYLNGEVLQPVVEGKRVLDLGTNNGVMPMMMLRAGAQEVVGLELSADFVKRARLVHQVFEWRDMRPYAFQVLHANMLDILEADYSGFDVITAFCTLYYLDEEDMARIVRRCADLADVLVVQGNESTRDSARDKKAYKSSTDFLLKIVEENGFPGARVHSKPGYSRPIIIGNRG